MFAKDLSKHSLEILEARIAPAAINPLTGKTELADGQFTTATVGTPILLSAGQGLSTGGTEAGAYLLYVEQGSARIFTTDFNNNGAIDFNEITGVAAGAGLRLISFVDIHGDIVTNLDPDSTLTDSNSGSAGQNGDLKGDGRIVRNSVIERIELRSLTTADLRDQDGDGTVDDDDVLLRLALSSYSIHGTIFAGGGFGVAGDATSGLIVDDTGRALQARDFNGGGDQFIDFKSTIGSIRVGTAVSGEYFSFGQSAGDDIQGLLATFTPAPGADGGDITNVRAANTATLFNINALIAGNGGVGARGGDIRDIQLNSDAAGGFKIVAGDGGRGASGGNGGSIINFSDFGSVTSQVIIQSGTGGEGSTGTGGNGGVLVFGEFNLNASTNIVLGDGGNGFIAGGNGASLARLTVLTPEGGVPFGQQITATSHVKASDPNTGRSFDPAFPDQYRHDPETGALLDPADPQGVTGIIGRNIPVDFNHDGIGDAVFTSNDPGQLVVMFGSGNSFDPFVRTETAAPGQFSRIYLDGFASGEALTVADFNGDGFQDIATASNEAGNFAGIKVFISRTEDLNGDNILTDAEDVDNDGTIDFLGFRDARESTLPTLSSYGQNPTVRTILANSAVPITDLEAGDFNGDGYTDLALTANYSGFQVLMFMTADIEDGRATGHFYADFGTKGQGEPPVGANPLRPFTILAAADNAEIEVTAMSRVATHDVVVGQSPGARAVTIADNSNPTQLGPIIRSASFGSVDTNRGNDVNLEPFEFRDFTINDFNVDGFADISAISQAPQHFFVAVAGNGITFNEVVTGTGNNRGIFFGNAGQREMAIRSADVDNDGTSDDVVILNYGPGEIFTIRNFTFEVPTVANPGTPGTLFNLTAAGSDGRSSLFGNDPVDTILAFDVYYPDATTTTGVLHLTAIPDNDPDAFGEQAILVTGGPFFPTYELNEFQVNISAGDGGNALVGRGGAGGSLGAGLSRSSVLDPFSGVRDVLGAINITQADNTATQSDVNLVAGSGGNGFSIGGSGGSITGTTVRFATGETLFTAFATLTAGDGGFGVAGRGGDGGDLRANSIEEGILFQSGNGGRGSVGGSGGDIVGNGTARIFDSSQSQLNLIAGSGGDGVRRGGEGGNIRNFVSKFDLFVLNAGSYLLSYVAGDGGSAISGPGGNGGSVSNVSPLRGGNQLAGDILLEGGNGGNGLSGGHGGSVSGFQNATSTSNNPAVVSFLAGSGGRGISGNGGNGGDVRGIETASRGFGDPLFAATLYGYDRVLAGDGGNSSGANGGRGGTVAGVRVTASDGPIAIVAGAGGSGLLRGGAGGNIMNTSTDVGGTSLAKALIIAGAGGDASAFLANPLDPTNNQGEKAFGGVVGRGGNGGSILGFVQGIFEDGRLGGSTDSRVDLIAGNGGSTINFGSISDTRIFVGSGGSIRNVMLNASAGNVLANVPLKSYHDVIAGETVAQFVANNLRDPLAPGSFTDDLGNVGIVVGASGRLKADQIGFDEANEEFFRSQPAFAGINGSLTNITARNITSAVAGAVERIAAIQSLSGLRLIANGVVGAPKDGPADYLDAIGSPVAEPVLDGRLIDGALIYSRFVPAFRGDRPSSNWNAFQLGNAR